MAGGRVVAEQGGKGKGREVEMVVGTEGKIFSFPF
jgi:hypothetical protein